MKTSTALLILASSSPRRKALLSQVGLKFDIIPSKLPESIHPGESPLDYSRRMAAAKAREVADRIQSLEENWVIGADTVVVCNGEILGKPVSQDDARAMLQKISGREHQVLTSFCIVHLPSRNRRERSVESHVRIKSLNSQEIEGYIRTGETSDKAGSYAIQGIGSFMVTEIRGSYTNVVGLPIPELLEELVKLGVSPLFSPVEGENI